MPTTQDQGYSADQEAWFSLDRWRAEPPLPLDDLLNNPVIRERIGRLIGDAMGPAIKPNHR